MGRGLGTNVTHNGHIQSSMHDQICPPSDMHSGQRNYWRMRHSASGSAGCGLMAASICGALHPHCCSPTCAHASMSHAHLRIVAGKGGGQRRVAVWLLVLLARQIGGLLLRQIVPNQWQRPHKPAWWISQVQGSYSHVVDVTNAIAAQEMPQAIRLGHVREHQ
jgi:hypothetical protein